MGAEIRLAEEVTVLVLWGGTDVVEEEVFGFAGEQVRSVAGSV